LLIATRFSVKNGASFEGAAGEAAYATVIPPRVTAKLSATRDLTTSPLAALFHEDQRGNAGSRLIWKSMREGSISAR